MKQIYLCLVLLAFGFTSLSAQDFDVPARWNGEKAIISKRASNFTYRFDEKRKNLIYECEEVIHLYIHKDDAPLKTIYLPEDYDLSVEHNRADGSQDNYDQGDAGELAVGEEATYFFKHLFENYSNYEKIVLESIEEGDMINLSYSKSETFDAKDFLGDHDCQAFPARLIVLQTSFPKSGHDFHLAMDNELYLNFTELISGPYINQGEDSVYDKVVVKNFEINEGAQDAMQPRLFSYPARQFPAFKFEVVYCSTDKIENTTAIAGMPGEPYTSNSEVELKRMMHNKASNYKNYKKVYKGLTEFLGDVRARGTESVLEAYYKGFQSYVYNSGEVENFDQDMFIGVMKMILDENEIDFDYILGSDKTLGTIEEMMFNSDIQLGMLIKERRDNYYLFPFNQYSNWNDYNHLVAGEDVYIFEMEKKLEDAKLNRGEVPAMMPAGNQTVIRANLTLGDGFTTMVMRRSISLKGHDKQEMASDLLTIQDYHRATLSRNQFKDYAEMRDEDEIEKGKKNRTALFRKMARAQFDTLEYMNFDLTTTGLDDEGPFLQVKEKIVVHEVVRFTIQDSMRVYKIDLGKFVGMPYEMKAGDRDLDGDVYVDYPRIWDCRVRMDIPSGYAVFSYDDFNKEMETELGTLKCSAEIKKGKLQISCSFVVKETNLDDNEWPKTVNMLSILEELNNMSITMAGN